MMQHEHVVCGDVRKPSKKTPLGEVNLLTVTR